MAPVDPRAEVVVLRDGAEVASWPLACTPGRVDLGTIDALARLQLRARRQGATVWLRHAGPELVELMGLVGLVGVLQVVRQAEGLEQRGVEEAVMPHDPVA